MRGAAGNCRPYRDRRKIEDAGFQVLSDEPDYTTVAIPPTDEAYVAAEQAGESTPETMELTLIHRADDEL